MPVKTTCETCGARVEKGPQKYARDDHHFCSQDCYDDWRSQVLQGDANPAWKGGKEERSCAWCGDPIIRYPSLMSERVFCDQGCQGKWLSKNRTGEDSYAWKGGAGHAYYGTSWRYQREQAKERDDYRCIDCGMTQATHVKEYKQGLDVHHIVPFEEFGLANHDKANRLDNLKTLCRVCHNGRR